MARQIIACWGTVPANQPNTNNRLFFSFELNLSQQTPLNSSKLQSSTKLHIKQHSLSFLELVLCLAYCIHFAKLGFSPLHCFSHRQFNCKQGCAAFHIFNYYWKQGCAAAIKNKQRNGNEGLKKMQTGEKIQLQIVRKLGRKSKLSEKNWGENPNCQKILLTLWVQDPACCLDLKTRLCQKLNSMSEKALFLKNHFTKYFEFVTERIQASDSSYISSRERL